MDDTPQQPERILIGISSCMLGNAVRYDGGHKEMPAIAHGFPETLQWVAVCPETDAGFGIPRPTIHLEQRGARLEVVTDKGGQLRTEPLERYVAAEIARLIALPISGFVCKARSPSCALDDGPLFIDGERQPGASGLFVMRLREREPQLPVADEKALRDAPGRERFWQEVLRYRAARLPA